MTSFPRVVGHYTEVVDTTNLTSHSFTFPTVEDGGIQANDLILVLGGKDGSFSVTNWGALSAGVVKIDGTATVGGLAGYYWASGGEDGTSLATITTSAAERGVWRVLCIRGVDPGTNPTFSAGATGNSTNADPDSVTVWNGEDCTVIEVGVLDSSTSRVITGPSSGYSGLQGVFGASAAALAYAFKRFTAAASSENPGAMTSLSEQWVAFSIGLRSAGVETDGTPAARQLSGSSSNVTVPAVGSLASLTAMTIAMIVRRDNNSATHGLIGGYDSGGSWQWGVDVTTGGTVFFGSPSGAASDGTWPFLSADGYDLLVFTRAAGSSQTPRAHYYNLDRGGGFDGSPMQHVAMSGAVNNPAASITTIRFGDLAGELLDGTIALVGIWGAALSDAECEELILGADGFGTNSWLNHSVAPLGVWEPGTDPTVDLTGNGADQSSASGATVSTTDIPIIWRFAPPVGGGPLTGAAAVAGAGAISASGVRKAHGAAALAGAGAISATGVATRYGAASVAGSGVLQAAGVCTRFGAAAVAGAGAISAAGTRRVRGAAAIAGTGSISATGSYHAFGRANVAGTGTIVATGSYHAYGIAGIAGAGAIQAAGLRRAFGAAAIAGDGSIEATGQVAGNLKHGKAAVAGAGSISAIGVRTAFATANVAGAGSISATGTVAGNVKSGAASVAGTGSISATGSYHAFGRATVNGTGAIIATGSRVAFGSAAVNGTGLITATGRVAGNVKTGSATVAGQGAISATGNPTRFAAATLTATGLISATGIRTAFGQATVAGTGVISATGPRPTRWDVTPTDRWVSTDEDRWLLTAAARWS